MESRSRKRTGGEAGEHGPYAIERLMRERARATIEAIAAEELERALGAHPSEGGTREWQSAIVPRHQRRTAPVDEAILGVYSSGTNTRRLEGPLAPLLRGGPLESARRVREEMATALRAGPRELRGGGDELVTFLRFPFSDRP